MQRLLAVTLIRADIAKAKLSLKQKRLFPQRYPDFVLQYHAKPLARHARARADARQLPTQIADYLAFDVHT